MTENYFVFLEQPMYINVMKLLVNKLRGQPMTKDLFEYDSEEKVNANIANKEFLFMYKLV